MRTLFDERYVAIVRHDHPAVGATLDLDTFCALDHVIVSPRGGGFVGPTDAALAAHGRSRRVAMSVPGFLIVPEIVARTDRIALVPERMAREAAPRFRISTRRCRCRDSASQWFGTTAPPPTRHSSGCAHGCSPKLRNRSPWRSAR